MKSYVYRIWPEAEKKQGIYRDILIQEDKTMEDFHHAILDSYGLADGEMASFFTCTKDWDEGLEIMLVDMGTMEHESVNILMEELTIGQSVANDIKYYSFMYDFLFPKRFKIERIAENKEIKEDIPVLLSEVGEYKIDDKLSGLNDIEEINSPKKNDIFDGFDDFDHFDDNDDDDPIFENIDDLDI
jgi:hypothetical protein|tara:strand:- start:1314 stop:1871 length:558 start_codon:yes stop_codon:yes gene_type:complete